METTQIAEGLIRFDKGGRSYLGLATYIPANGFALTKLTSQAREAGWLVRDGEVSRWRVAGFTRHSNQVFLYGDYLPCRSLAELLRLDWDHLLPYLIRLARAMSAAEREGAEIGALHTRSILFGDDGGVLFLAASVTRLISEQQSEADRTEFTQVYTHPDRSDAENRSFAVAVICYRALTGEFPFAASDEEELRDRMRACPPLEAWLRAPEVRPEVSAVLQAALEPAPSAAASGPTAAATAAHALGPEQQWARRLADWRSEGVHRRLTDEQRLAIQARALTTERKLLRTYRRREYWRRNWKKATAIALIVVLAGSVPGTMIRSWLEPRATAGMGPREVVTAFYSAINRLDHSTMEDAVVNGAGRDEIREVTNLYVMSRMRLAVELTTGFIDAEQWRNEGDGSIPEGTLPYGVARLRIEPQRELADTAEYLVRYEKWMPAAGPDPETAQAADTRVAVGLLRQDRVRLRMDKNDWVIYSIDRITESAIDPSMMNAAP